jgi:hypothetical protein
MNRQKEFSNLFFDNDKLSDAEREEITKTFVLSMHSEASELASSINFKDHRINTHDVDFNKILYKSVDIFRYTLALLNLWDIDPKTFVSACDDKDLFLHMRHRQNQMDRKSRPVVIFDVDDVIAEFRTTFNEWLTETYKIETDPESTEYYNTVGLMSAGIEPESVFREFIKADGFKKIPINTAVAESMKMLADAGYWIHLLTARPADNLKCFYDTYGWLNNKDICYHALDFSGEKFRWLADQTFFHQGDLVCAIDDSSKHAGEYAKHGVKVIVPIKSYNAEVHNIENITTLDFETITAKEIFDCIESIHHTQSEE